MQIERAGLLTEPGPFAVGHPERERGISAVASSNYRPTMIRCPGLMIVRDIRFMRMISRTETP